MKKIFFKTKAGYTIIETMIAISLFIIIVMMGMGALLNANLLRQKSQSMRSIIDNLSFTMEDMSRNLRTGYGYHCLTNSDFSSLTTPLSCLSPGGGGISFKNSLDGSQWVYFIGSYNGMDGILKSVDGGTNFIQLNPNEVVIDPVSSFIVAGAEPGDGKQPFITIKLVGKIISPNFETPFSLQTSVSQRLLDVGI